MNRVNLYANTRDSLPNLIRDLQDYALEDRIKLTDLIFSSYGFACETDETGTAIASWDTNLKPTSLGTTYEVDPGYALTSSLNWIYVDAGDVRNFPIAASTSYYIKVKTTYSQLIPKAEDFVLNPAAGQVFTRERESWEMTTTNPGVSGILLFTTDINSGITDARASNLLKFNYKLLDDIHIVKKNKANQLQHSLYLQSGLVMRDLVSGNDLTITPMRGLAADITYSGYQFYTALSGQHTHGTGNAYLSNINYLANDRYSNLLDILNSGYIRAINSSGYVITSLNVYTLSQSPLYALFNGGIINYGDNKGDRQIVTTFLNYVPNVPSGVTFSLVQERAPEQAPRKLRSALTAYNIKELEYSTSLAAHAGVGAWESYMIGIAAASGYTTASGLRTDAGVMYEASGLLSAGYITSYSQLYLDGTNDSKTITEVALAAESVMATKVSDQASIKGSMDVLSKEILQKGSRMKVRPNATINSKYHARLSWTEPELRDDDEFITGYDVRIYKYNADATNPGAVTPTQLASTYAPDVLSVQDVSTAKKRKTVGSVKFDGSSDWVANFGSGDYGTSENLSKWSDGYRIKVSTNPSLSLNIGDLIYTTDNILGKQWAKVIGIGQEIITPSIKPYYIDLSQPWIGTTATDSYTVYEEVYDGTTENTFVMFPIDIDEAYIAYVRAVNEYNMASAWSTAVYTQTNDLPDNQGVVLISGIQEDAAYLEEVNRIERQKLFSTYEEKLLDIERRLNSMPTQETITNITNAVNSLS